MTCMAQTWHTSITHIPCMTHITHIPCIPQTYDTHIAPAARSGHIITPVVLELTTAQWMPETHTHTSCSQMRLASGCWNGPRSRKKVT